MNKEKQETCENCGHKPKSHQYFASNKDKKMYYYYCQIKNCSCKKFKAKMMGVPNGGTKEGTSKSKGCGKDFYIKNNLYECGYKRLCPECEEKK